MPGGKDFDAAHSHVATALERDRFVGRTRSIGRRQARLGGLALTQAAAADQA